MMRTACAALLLAALAVPARAGCGPAEAKREADKAREDLHVLAARLAEVSSALADEKHQLAAADAALRKRAEALAAELAALREDRDRLLAGKVQKVRRLEHLQAQLEAQVAKLKDRLREKVPPAAKGGGAEDKLDLILKKLEDMDRRLRKLEGKPKGGAR